MSPDPRPRAARREHRPLSLSRNRRGTAKPNRLRDRRTLLASNRMQGALRWQLNRIPCGHEDLICAARQRLWKHASTRSAFAVAPKRVVCDRLSARASRCPPVGCGPALWFSPPVPVDTFQGAAIIRGFDAGYRGSAPGLRCGPRPIGHSWVRNSSGLLASKAEPGPRDDKLIGTGMSACSNVNISGWR